MDRAKQRVADRKNRIRRIRQKISGSAERPRLSVRRSLKHMYAQITDDVSGRVVAQVGSSSKRVLELLEKEEKKTKLAVAKVVGLAIGELGIEKGVQQVVFDRKGYAYQGRVKAVAEGARSKGLQF